MARSFSRSTRDTYSSSATAMLVLCTATCSFIESSRRAIHISTLLLACSSSLWRASRSMMLETSSRGLALDMAGGAADIVCAAILACERASALGGKFESAKRAV